jgi:hypothetical protein
VCPPRHADPRRHSGRSPRPTLLRNFAQIGLSMTPLLEQGNLRVQCRYPEATSLEDLLVDLRIQLESFAPSLIVMDSISSIEHSTSEKGFRQFMIGLASLLREHGRSALLTQTVAAGEAASTRSLISPPWPTPFWSWTTRRSATSSIERCA